LSDTTAASTSAYRPLVIESEGARQERESAEANGYEAGLAIGREQAQSELEQGRMALAREFADRTERLDAQYQQAISTIHQAAQSLHMGLVNTVGDAQDRINDVSVKIALAVIGMELTDASSAARAAINRVLTTVEFAEITEVRMHPDDVTAVAGMPELPHVKLTADDTISRGDAVATLTSGWLNARIDESLNRVHAALAADITADIPDETDLEVSA
jgi:flagellar assembly protein FliH